MAFDLRKFLFGLQPGLGVPQQEELFNTGQDLFSKMFGFSPSAEQFSPKPPSGGVGYEQGPHVPPASWMRMDRTDKFNLVPQGDVGPFSRDAITNMRTQRGGYFNAPPRGIQKNGMFRL